MRHVLPLEENDLTLTSEQVQQVWAAVEASGVYTYKLAAGSFSQTRSMVLLK